MIGNKECFYPLGTAVRTKDSSLISLIVGILPQMQDGNVADYLTVHYPCGYDGTANSLFLLNSDCISEVLRIGYKDEGFEFLSKHISVIEAKVRNSTGRVEDSTAVSILD